MWFRASLLVLLAVTGCSHPSLSGRYVGRVGDPCPGTASLSIGRGEAAFARDDGAQFLSGTVTRDGQVSTRVQTSGADKKGYVQTFTGQVRGKDATGTYSSPRCAGAPVTMHEG